MIRQRIKCQYSNVFENNNTSTYIYDMSEKMRVILKELMKIHGDTAHSLEKKSGVPQPTINRFLNSVHRSLNPENVEKIATAYNINSSQLMGNMPIEWLKLDKSVIPIGTATQPGGYDPAALQEKLIAMIKSIDPKKITPGKIDLIGMTLEAPDEQVPTLTTVTYAVSHPEQKYNAKKTKKKKQNGE